MKTSPNVRTRLATPAARANAFALLCALAVAAGCASEPDSHVVSSPPPPAPNTVPATVTTQSTTTTSGGVTTTQTQTQPATVVVTQALPVAQAEVVLAQPGPDYSWVPGYWTWRDNQYQWMAGHWEIPPHANAVWVPPHTEAENGAFRFYEGYWN
jgi:WXXGXW repeat (2 copies)